MAREFPSNRSALDSRHYEILSLPKAALVMAVNDNVKNSSIAFIVRGIAPHVLIAANADLDDSVDILSLSGCNHLF